MTCTTSGALLARCKLRQMGERLIVLGQHLTENTLAVKRGNKAAYGDPKPVFRYGRTNIAVEVDSLALGACLDAYHATKAGKEKPEQGFREANLSRFILP